MADILAIEFIFDWIILILSLTVFISFLWNIFKFVPGEAKRIFMLLTIFLGVYFMSLLAIDSLSILHFLGLHKGQLTVELDKTAELVAHIFQAIGAIILFYIAIIFVNFIKKLEKERKEA